MTQIFLNTFFKKSIEEELNYLKIVLDIGLRTQEHSYTHYNVSGWNREGISLSSILRKTEGYLAASDMKHWEVLSLRRKVGIGSTSPTSTILRVT